MFGNSEIIASFYGEYKTGLFGKKNKVALYIYEKNIEGVGVKFFEEKLIPHTFEVKIEKIRQISEKNIDGNKCLLIEYIDTDAIVNNIITVIFPCLENLDNAKSLIYELKEKKEKKLIERQESERQQIAERKKTDIENQKFFMDCYNFHIANENNPYYELQNDKVKFSGIYIDRYKNINFLMIDGYKQEESNAVIPYKDIHYYDKAGDIHYTTDINGHYTNYGGSITGGNISKTASIAGGLLFGTMGMAAGALLTHKPINIEMPNTVVDISSEIHKIDNRNIILNYYSDVKQQFIDIELPADIFNFLQTYLPEKRYEIVSELEKSKVLTLYKEREMLETKAQEVKKIEADDDTELFQKKVKKLKMMYEEGILSEEEFADEKRKLLLEIAK